MSEAKEFVSDANPEVSTTPVEKTGSSSEQKVKTTDHLKKVVKVANKSTTKLSKAKENLDPNLS